MHQLRPICSALFVAALVLFLIPDRTSAQGRSDRGNAHVMDLSLQFDPDVNKIACLGDPDSLVVKPGDVVVFRAKGTFVNDVRWSNNAMSQNDDAPVNLAMSVKGRDIENTGRFASGASFAIVVNEKIAAKSTYDLTVMCGDVEDAPPRIIVDP
jgi:hypothetical protein